MYEPFAYNPISTNPITSMLNPLRKTLFAAAAAGSLWLTAAVSPALAAPTAYQATGPILEMTDTTITVQFHGKEKWTFSKDASTTGAEGLKVGDSVTVHYTMAAASIEPSKSGADKADKVDKKAGKADKKAKAEKNAPGTTEAQKPAAEPGVAASPATTPGQLR